jgi:hypothetical protein
MVPMENFRDFEAGPDPFGRTWHAQFKYLQTAISIRHSDSIDVCYVLESGGERMKKTVVIPHAEMRTYCQRTGRTMSDTLCSRVAMCQIRHMIETAEDLDKDYLVLTPREIEEFDSTVKKWEDEWVKQHAA